MKTFYFLLCPVLMISLFINEVALSQECKKGIEVSVKKVEAATVAYTLHQGPYSGVGSAIEKVNKWIREVGLTPQGPPIAVYLNDPQEVPPESLLTEVQWPVKGAKLDSLKKLEGEVKLKDIPATEVAYTIHTGGYEEIGLVHKGIINWIAGHDYRIIGPPQEVYLTDFTTPMEKWRTEIRFPVKKKKAPEKEIPEEGECPF